jgi:hypothetical protein
MALVENLMLTARRTQDQTQQLETPDEMKSSRKGDPFHTCWVGKVTTTTSNNMNIVVCKILEYRNALMP